MAMDNSLQLKIAEGAKILQAMSQEERDALDEISCTACGKIKFIRLLGNPTKVSDIMGPGHVPIKTKVPVTIGALFEAMEDVDVVECAKIKDVSEEDTHITTYKKGETFALTLVEIFLTFVRPEFTFYCGADVNGKFDPMGCKITTRESNNPEKRASKQFPTPIFSVENKILRNETEEVCSIQGIPSVTKVSDAKGMDKTVSRTVYNYDTVQWKSEKYAKFAPYIIKPKGKNGGTGTNKNADKRETNKRLAAYYQRELFKY